MESLRTLLLPFFQGEFAAVSAAMLWSVSVILLRVSGLSLAPVPLTFFKSLVALGCFGLTILAQGLPLLPDLGQGAYLRLVVSAILGIALADTLFLAALNRLGASLQALADCIYAPSVAAVGFLMFGEALTGREILGGTLVLAGVAVGVGLGGGEGASAEATSPEGASSGKLWEGVVLAAFAHVIMAVGILMVRDVLRAEPVVWVCGFRFMLATVLLGIYAVLKGEDLKAPFRRFDLYKWTLTLSVLGPYLATIFWATGFKYTTPGRAAIYNQLSTVFIIILARLFLGEQMTPRRFAGVVLAGLGSLLVATSGQAG